MMEPQPREIVDFLLSQFRPDPARDLSACVRFVWGQDDRDECRIAIEQDGASVSNRSTADLTLVFASSSLMQGILCGENDPLEHFLTGEFRSDGGLPLIFPILEAFSRNRQ